MSAFLRRSRPAAAAIAAAVLLTACGMGDDTTEPASAAQEDADPGSAGTDVDTDAGAEAATGDHDMDDMEAAAVDLTAEELRATLNRLLQEHVYLAGLATGEALAGNEAGFEAAAEQLTQGNTADLADLVGAVYGADVREQFFGFWNSHIDMFVDYTVATADGDEAGQEAAVERLLGYSQELADTFESLTDGELPASATQPAIQEHVVTLKDAVDAQAAGDAEAAFANLRTAAHHMDGMAEALAGAIATQHGLEGDASSDLAGVRSELNALLQEHVYLAGAFTGAALAGEDATAAQDALIGGNTEDLADLVAAVYGDRADRGEFVQFWNSHILMFAAYTEGVATDDAPAQQAAVDDLLSYAADLAVAFEQLTAGELPASASQPLIQEHITSLAPAVDAQGAGDPATAYAELRNAAAHMQMIAFPLFDATVASL